jgi:hypothetical protein
MKSGHDMVFRRPAPAHHTRRAISGMSSIRSLPSLMVFHSERSEESTLPRAVTSSGLWILRCAQDDKDGLSDSKLARLSSDASCSRPLIRHGAPVIGRRDFHS